MRVALALALLSGVGFVGCATLLGDFTASEGSDSGSDTGGGETGPAPDAATDGTLDASSDVSNAGDARAALLDAGDAGLDAAKPSDAGETGEHATPRLEAGVDGAGPDAEGGAVITMCPLDGATCPVACNATSCAGCCSGDTCRPLGGTIVSCAGTCANTASDVDNCGRCAHPCGPGLCEAGVCQPATLVPSIYFPTGIALTSTAMYWTESQDSQNVEGNGSVNMASLSGGSYSIIASQQNGATDIAANADGVFWTTQSDFTQTPALMGGVMWLANGTTAPVRLGGSYDSPAALALTSSAVYWADDTTSSYAESLLSLPLSMLTAGAMPTAVNATSADAGITCVLSMVPNATALYMMTSGCFAQSGRLLSSTLEPLGAPNNLLLSGTALSGPYGQARIAIDSANVYFANSGTGVTAIVSVPVAGGALSVRAPATSPGGVAVDANNIYWTDAQDGGATAGGLYSIPIAGGAVTTLASGQNGPYDIALTGTAVFWTNMSANGNGPGSIMSVGKP